MSRLPRSLEHLVYPHALEEIDISSRQNLSLIFPQTIQFFTDFCRWFFSKILSKKISAFYEFQKMIYNFLKIALTT